MKKIALFCLFVIAIVSAEASHLAGGEISYKCIGFRRWEITMVIYRDCNGIPMPGCAGTGVTNCTKTLTVKPMATIAGGGLNLNGCASPVPSISVTVTSYQVEDANKIVQNWIGPSAKNICDNRGTATPGSYNPSVEKYYYKGILDMSSPVFNNACAYWEVIWEECCRNNGTENILNAGGVNFYITAAINIFYNQGPGACKNNSPEIKNPPTLTVCSSQPVELNLGTFDPDGDSLAYAIIPARGAGGVITQSIPPYGPTYPFPLNSSGPPHTQYPQPFGAYIILDTATGDISFNALNNHPTLVIFGNVAIQITQWSKDVNGNPHITGRTMGEYQIYVRSCPNNNPVNLTSGNSFPKRVQVAPNDTLRFSVQAKDDDDGPGPGLSARLDTTRFLNWITSTPLITVTRPINNLREDSIVVTYVPVAGQLNTIQSITFVAADNSGPNLSLQSRQILIDVFSNTGFKATINRSTDSCKRYSLSYTNDSNVANVNWRISRVPNDYSLTNVTSYGNLRNLPKIGFALPGKYLVRLNITRIAPANTTGFITDTIEVTPTGQTLFPPNFDTALCIGNSRLMTLPLGNYNWFVNNSSTVFVNNDTLLVTPTVSTNYRYTGTVVGGIYNGCVLTDTANIVVNPLPNTNLPDTLQICENAVTNLNAANTSAVGTKYLWNTNDSTVMIQVTQPGLYTVLLTQTNGCARRDSVRVINNVKPVVAVRNDTNICAGSSLPMFASGASSYQWQLIQGSGLTSLSNQSLFTYTPATSPTQIRLQAFNGLPACGIVDTVVVTLRDRAVLIKPSDRQLCDGAASMVSVGKFTSNKSGIGVWSFVAVPTALSVSNDSAYLNVALLPKPPIGSTAFNRVRYTFTDTTGCVSIDSALVMVHSTPNTNAGLDKTYCNGLGVINLANSQGATPSGGIFSFPPATNAITTVDLKSFTDTRNYTYRVTYTYSSLSCSKTDTFAITSNVTPVLTRPFVKHVCNDSAIITMSPFASSPSGGVSLWSYPAMPAALNTLTSPAKLNIGMLPQPTVTNSRIFWVRYQESLNGCTATDSAQITVNAKPPVNAGTDKTLCNSLQSVNLKTLQNPTPISGQFFRTVSNDSVTVLNLLTAPAINQLYYRAAQNYSVITCVNYDTVTLSVAPSPILTRPAVKVVCSNDNAVQLSAFTSINSGVGTWSYPTQPNALSVNNGIATLDASKLAAPVGQTPNNIWIRYQEILGNCTTRDSAQVLSYLARMVNAGADDTLCNNNAPLTLSVKQQPNPTGGYFVNVNLDSLSVFNPANAIFLPGVNNLTYLYPQIYPAITCISRDNFVYSVVKKADLTSITGNVLPNKNATLNYSTDAFDNHNYLWVVSGGGTVQSSNLNNATILWTDTGAATIKVTVSNPECGSDTLTQAIQVSPPVGLNEANGLSNVILYPNPTVGEVFITGNTSEQHVQIEVFNNTLQLVYSQNVKTELGNINAQFNTATLSNGLYFVKIGNGNKYGVYKLVVLK